MTAFAALPLIAAVTEHSAVTEVLLLYTLVRHNANGNHRPEICSLLI